MTHSELTALLRKEMTLATGCTGPTAYALAAANCRRYMTAPAETIEVCVSPAYLKMGVGVATPGTDRKGIEIAAAAGLVCGDPDAGMQVLKNASPEDIEKAAELADSGIIKVRNAMGKRGVYVLCEIATANETVSSLVEKTHDGVAWIKVNEKTVFEAKAAEEAPRLEDDPEALKLNDIFEYVSTASLEEVGFILDAYRVNRALAEDGLKKALGLGSGKALLRKSLKDRGMEESEEIFNDPLAYLPDDPAECTDILVSAASDARMGGSSLPAVAAMGDGNQGITATLPIGVFGELGGHTELETARALALSCLMLFFVKMNIGRAAAMCLCAIAASAGVAAGLGRLNGLSEEQIKAAVKNTITPLTGMVCDGAKGGCALKMSVAARTAISSVSMAAYGVEVGFYDGISNDSLEETIANITDLANSSMDTMDNLMVETILSKKKA